MKSFISLFVAIVILTTSTLTQSSPISPTDHESTAAVHPSVTKDAEISDSTSIISQHGESSLRTKVLPSHTIPFVSNPNFQRFRRDEISDYEGWEK